MYVMLYKIKVNSIIAMFWFLILILCYSKILNVIDWEFWFNLIVIIEGK